MNAPRDGAGAEPPAQRTFSYSKSPVRCRVIEGEPFFAASDLYSAARLAVPDEAYANWEDGHIALHLFDGPNGTVGLEPAVTLTGALTIVADAPYPAHNILAAWLRKRVREDLAPPRVTLPAIRMAYLADGRVPPRPKRSTDIYDDWLYLSVAQTKGFRYLTPLGVWPEKYGPFYPKEG